MAFNGWQCQYLVQGDTTGTVQHTLSEALIDLENVININLDLPRLFSA